jgi:uncharacterized RDD family membrane protein YckC
MLAPSRPATSSANNPSRPSTSPIPNTLRHAGFWVRFLAALVDLIVLAIPFSVFITFLAVRMGIWYAFFFASSPGQPPNEVLREHAPTLVTAGLTFFILTSWLYFAFMESSAWRATYGKHLFSICVTDERGDPIDFWRASLRFASGRLLAHIPQVGIYYFLVDCLCVGFHPAKRALHDLLSRCLVLHEFSDTPPPC